MKMGTLRLHFFLVAICLSGGYGFAADTLKISVSEAEKQFLEKNLLLLAGQFNISATEAFEIQAKAYSNPTFTADFNFIDPQNKRMFHIGETGQKVFVLDQLILLGGKRKTQIEIAGKNKEIAKLEFEEMLRNLRWRLNFSLYEVNRKLLIIQNYEQQLLLLDTIITNYDIQSKKGNIAIKEAIRLKSAYLNFNNARSELLSTQIEDQQVLQLLLQENRVVSPQIPENDFIRFITTKSEDELINLSLENRPDLKIFEKSNELSALNLRFQKQLAIPDLNINTSYDQRGGAFNNQINLGFSVPLPVFNRNKGAIKAAEYSTKTSEVLVQQKREEAKSEVRAAFRQQERSINDYTKTLSLYSADFELVFKGIRENFQKRNVSLIEFVDFFEAYNQSLTEFQKVKAQLAIAAAKINYITSTPVY